jgi:hypothetical protein
LANPNLQLLVDAARLLKRILNELVFLGGCTTALLITDKATADVRPTHDVDAIAEITSYAAYTVFSGRLKDLGFTEDTSEGFVVGDRNNESGHNAARWKKCSGFQTTGTNRPWIPVRYFLKAAVRVFLRGVRRFEPVFLLRGIL